MEIKKNAVKLGDLTKNEAKINNIIKHYFLTQNKRLLRDTAAEYQELLLLLQTSCYAVTR